VPERKRSFLPISASDSNFNPRNTTSITACPVGPADRTGVVNPPKFGGGSSSPLGRRPYGPEA